MRETFRDSLPYYLTYLQEIPYAYDVIGANRPSPFAHSWSRGIEEKYYLVWPVLIFAFPRRRLASVLAVLALGFSSPGGP